MSIKEKPSIDEVLLALRTPSELVRSDAALIDGGADARELAAVKNALGAMATDVTARGHGCGMPLKKSAASLRERIVASASRKGKYGIYTDRLARLFDLKHENAAKLVAKLDDPAAWRPWFGEAMKMIPVKPGPAYPEGIGAIGRLVPGSDFPLHEHVGDEATVVLDGGFMNDDGTEVWRGDELFLPAGTDHRFHVLDGVDCVAAVICYRGVTFK